MKTQINSLQKFGEVVDKGNPIYIKTSLTGEGEYCEIDYRQRTIIWIKEHIKYNLLFY